MWYIITEIISFLAAVAMFVVIALFLIVIVLL